MVNRSQMYNLETWIKETSSLPKARRAITENILLRKCQKQAITANEEATLMLLPNALRKLRILLEFWSDFNTRLEI